MKAKFFDAVKVRNGMHRVQMPCLSKTPRGLLKFLATVCGSPLLIREVSRKLSNWKSIVKWEQSSKTYTDAVSRHVMCA